MTTRDQPRPEPARTTKTVTATLTATFHGDYLDRDEVGQYLECWIDSGLDDRDGLRRWTFQVQQVEEVSGDPNGYDD